MYLPIAPTQTCAAAWLKATSAVALKPGHEAHNVIIGVQEPTTESVADRLVINLLDDFLRGKDRMPIQSVANTIFPQDIYRRHGAPKIYKVYEQVYEYIKKPNDWGRYFDRMTRRATSGGDIINPLSDLIAKLNKHVHGEGKTFRNIYELVVSDPTLDVPIYNPECDAGRTMNRQCLSFLSFKLDHDNRLMLTAIYRNHYYIERLLGNLIGLARLMTFVGNEVSLQVGGLTVVSTHGVVDTPKNASRGDVDELLSACRTASEADVTAQRES